MTRELRANSVELLLERAARRAQASGVFADVSVHGGVLSCGALGSAAPAFYRLGMDDEHLYVSLVTQDRWLSQSIEQDLVHTGDKLTDLLEEELVDLGYEHGSLRFEHFRSQDMLYTFRSPVPVDQSDLASERAAEIAGVCLLAYEAMFRELGDMAGDKDE